jgi:ABC-type transport system involved in multi-copper enzyme maturation permease subunit
MRSLTSATLLLFRTQLARLVWSRRSLACFALAAAPPCLAWIASRFNSRISGADIAAHIGWLLLIQVITPLCALVCGSAVVTEEIENRTITYLFSRPIPRAAVLLGRWLAALVVVSVSLGSSAVLTAGLASFSKAPGPLVDAGVVWPLLAAALLGGAVYSGLFAAAGVFFRHPMIVGLGYAFAIEGFLANLPGKNQALTVQYYLRSVIAATGSGSWQDIEGFSSSRFDTLEGSIATLAVLLLGVLALASLRISRKEFVLSA